MQSPKTKCLTVALAAIMVLGTLDAASARQKKKYRAAKPAVSKVDRVPGTLVPLDVDGTPIIMQGYSSPRMMRDGTAQPAAARRPPGENPARQQHLHSAAQSVALFPQQPAGRGADPARARSPTSRRRSPPSAIG